MIHIIGRKRAKSQVTQQTVSNEIEKKKKKKKEKKRKKLLVTFSKTKGKKKQRRSVDVGNKNQDGVLSDKVYKYETQRVVLLLASFLMTLRFENSQEMGSLPLKTVSKLFL